MRASSDGSKAGSGRRRSTKAFEQELTAKKETIKSLAGVDDLTHWVEFDFVERYTQIEHFERAAATELWHSARRGDPAVGTRDISWSTCRGKAGAREVATNGGRACRRNSSTQAFSTQGMT